MLVKTLVEKYQMLPHPEGGYYKETYRSEEEIPNEALPARFSGNRNFYTSILFLLEQGNFSAFHKIKSDEIWHFYEGDALEVFEISEKGKLEITLLGRDIENGETFQHAVKAGRWFASRVIDGGTFSLVGCSVSPGFDFQDFELAKRDALIMQFPELRDTILSLTRE